MFLNFPSIDEKQLRGYLEQLLRTPFAGEGQWFRKEMLLQAHRCIAAHYVLLGLPLPFVIGGGSPTDMETLQRNCLRFMDIHMRERVHGVYWQSVKTYSEMSDDDFIRKFINAYTKPILDDINAFCAVADRALEKDGPQTELVIDKQGAIHWLYNGESADAKCAPHCAKLVTGHISTYGVMNLVYLTGACQMEDFLKGPA